MTCKSGAPTQDGSKYSDMITNNSSTGQTTRYLMSRVQRMKKEPQLEFMETMERITKNGKFFMLTRLLRLRPRDSMRNSDSTLTDHSTSSQSFHSTESLRCLVVPTWLLRDGETMLETNNSGSMKSPRLLETTTGRTTALISKATEIAIILELFLASTQDGGNCSDTKTVWL